MPRPCTTLQCFTPKASTASRNIRWPRSGSARRPPSASSTASTISPFLYARGVGVERDIVESYKWFALAGKGGDKDAGKKSLEVASHLDEQQLSAARQSVEAFVPEAQPEEAISVKAPPGGWDQMVAAARKTGPASR